ncbi:MAG: undecaprenyl-diphosphate phosphatase [Bacteroidales bacterium]|nr:undecaprenyl-diphosphate phosphatase [Bacteroidales bacterium]HOY38412.1 undecaprenyl-diphosphate phosphatase [Bacteroidales bacterium]HQP05117.1 undecaprenyl-diphosphate phosphatase [Bacteroidales bacterium]
MSWFEALILGLVQGLTEFLPVSSSGHLEIGKAIFNIKGEENIYFSIAVHGATVLSTILVLRKELTRLVSGVFKFKLNEETHYLLKIAVSMIPVLVIGLLFKDYLKTLFDGSNMVFIGLMLLVTALLLTFTYFFKPKQKPISYFDAFIIGVAQAIAVVPGISRSGATISTGLMLGNKKEDIAKFSFLMVIIPILGENFLEIVSGNFSGSSGIEIMPLIVGSIAAFISGWFACSFMIRIVQRGKLIWFAVYCAVIGLVSILFL